VVAFVEGAAVEGGGRYLGELGGLVWGRWPVRGWVLDPLQDATFSTWGPCSKKSQETEQT